MKYFLYELTLPSGKTIKEIYIPDMKLIVNKKKSFKVQDEKEANARMNSGKILMMTEKKELDGLFSCLGNTLENTKDIEKDIRRVLDL